MLRFNVVVPIEAFIGRPEDFAVVSAKLKTANHA
jgi:hypothetical protein